MKEGYIDEFDIKRIVKAVEETFKIEQIEKGKYVISNEDSTDDHVTDLVSLHCTCKDYKYNCKSKESKTEDEKYCKHIYRAMFEVHGML